MRIGSLFSGGGGLDLAALELFPGSSVAWHVESDEAPARVLARHWPNVPIARDVRRVSWPRVVDKLGPVEVVTAGYPCQPFSAGGLRRGEADERHLWPYVRTAIRELRPRYVLLENVSGHRSLGFDRVLGDLAEDGLDARWTSVRASDVGAPHRRDRLFVLVTPPDAYRPRREGDPVGRVRAGIAPAGDRATRRPAGTLDWGRWGAAVARWEALTRPAPFPYEPDSSGRPRFTTRFGEWLMGLPDGWVEGLGLNRHEVCRVLGNGVVPQQAVAAYSYLLNQLPEEEQLCA